MTASQSQTLHHEGPLSGSLIAAMPAMQDDRFKRGLIYICHHDEQGAMGLIINKPVPNMDFHSLLERFKFVGEKEDDDEESDYLDTLRRHSIYIGGPVEVGRGLLLHSNDYSEDQATLTVGHGLCITTTTTILKAIAENQGPQRFLFALGYAGWGAGQLESEILENSWLNYIMPPDMLENVLFNIDYQKRYDAVLSDMGINSAQLSLEGGHC